MNGDIHAVVVRWRGGDEVRTCLRSLLEHGGDRLAGVTLVDSGSADGGAARLADEFTPIRVIALEENLGFAHAANRGAEGADTPLLLLLNPDTELLPGALATLAAGADAHPEAAGVVPLLAGPDGQPQLRWQLRRLPTPMRLATGRPGAPACARLPAPASEIAQPAAAAWLVRRAAWDALGGLDEGFAPAWWEDVDFCARLATAVGKGGITARAGFLLYPAATILHSGGSSVACLGREAFAAAYHRNLLRYAAKHHPRRYPTIVNGLRLTLALRSFLQPTQRTVWAAALAEVRTARQSAPGGSRGSGAAG